MRDVAHGWRGSAGAGSKLGCGRSRRLVSRAHGGRLSRGRRRCPAARPDPQRGLEVATGMTRGCPRRFGRRALAARTATGGVTLAFEAFDVAQRCALAHAAARTADLRILGTELSRLRVDSAVAKQVAAAEAVVRRRPARVAVVRRGALPSRPPYFGRRVIANGSHAQHRFAT